MNIVIVGAGGHGRVVLDILRSNHQFDLAGFLDANKALHNKKIGGLRVLGDLSMVDKFEEYGIGGAIIAIGDNRIRDAYTKKFEQAGVNLVSAIHPSANIASTCTIGKNVVIAAGANICTLAAIEDSVIINTGSIIDHESNILKSSHICPGVRIAGHVTVQPYAFVGIGATIIQGITIGQNAVVGAGAVVVQDVESSTTVVGVPAKAINMQPTYNNENPGQDEIDRFWSYPKSASSIIETTSKTTKKNPSNSIIDS